MSDVNIEVSKDVVEGIIRKKIEAGIVDAFTDKQELIRNMVNLALTRKVDSNGKVSASSYANKFDLFEILFSKALKEEAEVAIKAAIEKHKATIQKHVETEISRKKGTLAKLMVANLSDSLGQYNFKLDISPKPID